MGKDKKDLSKEESIKEESKKEDKSNKKKKQNQPSFSNLTDAEYEAMFLERFESQNKQPKTEKENNTNVNKIQLLKPIDEDAEESEKVIEMEIEPKLDNKKLIPKEIPRDIVKVKPAVLREIPKEKVEDNKPKYGATADFSWMDKPIEYVRHCPKCNKFIKTDNPDDLNCPVCNTQMRFSIHCKSCNLWFDVKGPKKYPCPRCNQIISHGSS